MSNVLIDKFESNILYILDILSKIIIDFENYSSEIINLKIPDYEEKKLAKEENIQKIQSNYLEKNNTTKEKLEIYSIIDEFRKIMSHFNETAQTVFSINEKKDTDKVEKNKIELEKSKNNNLDSNVIKSREKSSNDENIYSSFISTLLEKSEKIYIDTLSRENYKPENNEAYNQGNLQDNLELVFSEKFLENHSVEAGQNTSVNTNNSLNISALNVYTQSNNPEEIAKNTMDSLQNEFNSNLVLSANTGVRVKG